LPVTFTSSNAVVGQLKKTGAAGASVTINMPVNQYYTPTTVASGGVAFDPLSGGTTTVTATAPGFNNSWSEASAVITVNLPVISITDPWANYFKVGGGLQKTLRVNLDASEHGGVTVRITSSDTIRLLVSTTATTAGTSFIDISIPNGQIYKDFYVQGINGVTGNVTISATNLLFTTGTRTVEVVQGVVQIVGLPTSKTVASANDAFYVQTGVANAAGTSVQDWQNVSPAAPIHVLLTSSNVTAGQLVTNAETGDEVTVDVPVNTYQSPTTKAAGGVEFDPLAVGSTAVSASVIGFNNLFPPASVTVNVTP
jgi:hypothetical protein